MERIWQKHYCKGVPHSMRFQNLTLPQALSQTAARFPNSPALMFKGTVITFRELADLVARFAGVLKGLGVKPGDKVSVVLPNLVQTVVAIYGALRAGAVVVMHNPRNDEMLMEYQLKDAGSAVVVSLDVLVPRMMARRRGTKVRKIISCHIRDYLPFLAKQLFPFVKKELHLKTPDDPEVYEFKELVDNSDPMPIGYGSKAEDTAFILYTSATTGRSKGVELTHRNLSVNTQQLRSWFPAFRDGQEIVVGCLPFFHVFGLTCALNIGIFAGFGNVLVPLPEPKAILEAIHEHKATFIPALPTAYTGMMYEADLDKYSLKSLRGCFSGGAPLPLETIRAFEQRTGAQICEGYGLTESSPVTHVNPFGGKTKVGTIGLPIPETEAKIADLDDYNKEITEPGVPGELCIRGPQVMRGYVNLPEQTADALRDGWLFTGDVVTRDEEGYFTIVDRRKDIITSRGVRVFPRDVDEVLFQHPKVLDACAIGVPDPMVGEIVKVFIVLKKGERATSLDILDHCKKHLPPEQVPRQLQFLSELPRSPVGKILRKELSRMHAARRPAVGQKPPPAQ
jgi:long-chain acyl-CoA synthetase